MTSSAGETDHAAPNDDGFEVWRTPPQRADPASLERLGRELARVALCDDPRFDAAANGCAASAIGLAFDHVWSGRVADLRKDLILAALWRCAARGDAAAAAALRVVSHRVTGTQAMLGPHFDDVDKDDKDPSRWTPGATLARELLREAIPAAMAQAIEADRPELLILVAPGGDCVRRLAGAIPRLWDRVEIIVVAKAPRPNAVNDLSAALMGPAIVVTGDLAWLPPEMAAASDHLVTVTLTPKVVARAIGAKCASRPPRLGPADLAGLRFEDVALAIRHGSSAAGCVARLRRAVARKASEGRTAAAPPLEALGGYGPALDEIRTIADGVKRALKQGLREPAPSLLFYGPPGTGKTMLAAALARSTGLPMVRSSVAAWFVGDGHLGAVITEADAFFRSAEAYGDCVAFLDEIDAIPDRDSLKDNDRAWWTTIATGLLTMIDRTRATAPGVLLVAATNQYDKLDAAVKRPGRFDRHIPILPPQTIAEMTDVLRLHAGGALDAAAIATAAEVVLAQRMTGAAVEAATRQAFAAARAAGRPLALEDLLGVIAPPDRREPAARAKTAIHEAGHAILAHALGIPVEQVSVIRNGTSLGATTYRDDGLLASDRATVEAHVVAALGGRAADEVVSGAATAGAILDLKVATRLVAALHGCFGLGASLLSRGELDTAEAMIAHDPAFQRLVDDELDRLMERARELARRHAPAIRRLAELLLARRTASGQDVETAFESPLRDSAASGKRDSRVAQRPLRAAPAIPDPK